MRAFEMRTVVVVLNSTEGYIFKEFKVSFPFEQQIVDQWFLVTELSVKFFFSSFSINKAHSVFCT